MPLEDEKPTDEQLQTLEEGAEGAPDDWQPDYDEGDANA